MPVNEKTQTHLDETYLMLLERGGVDNWEWYGDSLEDVPEDADTTEIVDALRNGGVDDWTWHDESIGEFAEYSDYVEEFTDDSYLSYDEWVESDQSKNSDEDEPTPTIKEETPVKEISEQNKWLLDYIENNYSDENDTQELFEKTSATIWKRTTFPKEFDKATKKASASKSVAKNFLLDSSKNLFEMIEKNGKLDKFIQENIS